jgi:hypothetical protein
MRMSFPSIVLGIVISVFLGASFHLWRGGSGGKLLLYLLLSITGFWIGQYIGGRFNLTFASVGSLHLGMGLVVGMLFLSIGNWLSQIEPEKKADRRRP